MQKARLKLRRSTNRLFWQLFCPSTEAFSTNELLTSLSHMHCAFTYACWDVRHIFTKNIFLELIKSILQKRSVSGRVDTEQQTDGDRRMFAQILLAKRCIIPLQHQFFWHLETNSAHWRQSQGMPVAIATIISAVATSVPVGTFGIPCEMIGEEKQRSLKTFTEQSWRRTLKWGQGPECMAAHADWSWNFFIYEIKLPCQWHKIHIHNLES